MPSHSYLSARRLALIMLHCKIAAGDEWKTLNRSEKWRLRHFDERIVYQMLGVIGQEFEEQTKTTVTQRNHQYLC